MRDHKHGVEVVYERTQAFAGREEAHLTHVRHSVEAHGERLVIEPAQCRDCGFACAERSRTTKPSRCPQCKSEHLAPPVFTIHGRRTGASA